MRHFTFKDDDEIKAGERRRCVVEPVKLSAMDSACIIQFLHSRLTCPRKSWMLDVLANGSKEFREPPTTNDKYQSYADRPSADTR